jgi:hypothetical protein
MALAVRDSFLINNLMVREPALLPTELALKVNFAVGFPMAKERLLMPKENAFQVVSVMARKYRMEWVMGNG